MGCLSKMKIDINCMTTEQIKMFVYENQKLVFPRFMSLSKIMKMDCRKIFSIAKQVESRLNTN